TSVEKGSPAAVAGLEVGDIINEVNSQRIRDEEDIWRVIDDSDLRGGDELRLTVLRNRKTFNVSLRLQELRR
ncbi:MAG: PDZ domain-containing protein, partial [Calditrichaeota bacterium]|nr:PDZ domain-containing protein [Calditrichota bacterium]